ncbi:MAG: translation initiation factor IF-2 [Chloroflexota bacterium]
MSDEVKDLKEEKKEETDEKSIELPGIITVRDFAEKIESSPIDIIKVLMTNGVMANINQQIDFDTAAIVAAELGFEATLEVIDQMDMQDTTEIALWRRLIADEDPKDLVSRPPVVTILGHVDHGKTTLLDSIRSSSVASGEAGGITQHISAYQVVHNDRKVTFLDTPGHAAFTAMRSRGAQGADVVILVVAADDGVMPQTKEALNHAKAAQVPIVVAMNKIDKSNANPERVKQQLAEAGLVPDDWDGDTIVVPISALKNEGLDDLLEAILLVADNTEILANPAGKVFGTVIEAQRDRAKGVVATMLVQNGSVKMGDIIVAGSAYGRIKAMFDYHGNKIEEAGPSMPISVMGFNNVPDAGDLFRRTDTDKEARAIITEREDREKNVILQAGQAVTLENVFARVQEGKTRELRLVIKGDVQGSLEPVISSLEEITASDESGKIKVKVLHSGTGNISENDIMLAGTSQAVVMGFNVSADSAAHRLAEKEKVDIRTYDIIYRMIEDVEMALKGMLIPEEKETVIGKAVVQALFKVPKIGHIAGCRVVEGDIKRNALIRVLRGGEELHVGEISSLKHEKDDVKEVRNGFECGIAVKGFTKFKEGDILECFIVEVVEIV